MLTVKIFVFNPLQENTYIVYDESREAIIFDPGCSTKEEEKKLTTFVTTENLRVTGLYNTHCHVDHVLGNAFVKRQYGVKLFTSKIEEAQLRSVKLYAPMYGFAHYEETEVDAYLKAGDEILCGSTRFTILSVPGHSPGHIAFYCAPDKFCIAGDVLFRESIGRSDLPGGNFVQLENSIRTQLYTLPDATIIYPGHGAATDIGYEKQNNPYVHI